MERALTDRYPPLLRNTPTEKNTLSPGFMYHSHDRSNDRTSHPSHPPSNKYVATIDHSS